MKVPYMSVVDEREEAAAQVAGRSCVQGDEGVVAPLDKFGRRLTACVALRAVV